MLIILRRIIMKTCATCAIGKEIFLIIILTLFATTTYAFDPVGIPGGWLDEGQGKIALEYSHSKLDIHADSSTELGYAAADIKDIDIDQYTANFGLGLTRDIEIFIRTGIIQADPDNSDNDDNVGGDIGKSKDSFLFGGGLKFNIYRGDKFSWGLTAQTSWNNISFGGRYFKGAGTETKTKIKMFNTQIATGPAYKLNDSLTIYGGPFFHFVNGDVEMKDKIGSSTTTYEDSILEEDSILGGFVGGQWEFYKDTLLNIECLFTDSGYGVAGGVIWKF